MTNKEKEQYLSNMMIYFSHPFFCELNKRDEFLSQMPKILYKYRSFDKYTKEMLEEPYVFLAPVKYLDDPFDCLAYSGIENTKADPRSIGLAMADYIINLVCYLGNVSIDKKEVKKLVNKSYVNGEFNEIEAKNAFYHSSLLSPNENEKFFNIFNNIDNVTDTIIEDKTMGDLITTTLNSSEKVGVFSASTKRDNKVMWSLYSRKYKGYCVEYEIPDERDIRFNLCPVIYKRNSDNNLIKYIVKFAVANCLRFVSGGELNNGVGCMNELFCTKDTDWAYQDEWRLIGNANDHCHLLKVKAVYIGFKASIRNINKIKRIGKKKGFKVFLMNSPSGKKKITYKEI